MGPTADVHWHARAACRGVDGTVFYPVGASGCPDRARSEETAKRYCAVCPVVEPCRRHALSLGAAEGVWGGLTEHERAGLHPSR